jgi:4'-phosphopantetheinyl transferase
MRCDVWWSAPVVATPRLVALLDDVERERYGSYRREIDQRRFLTGRTLIRTVAAERLGIDPSAVRLDASCFDCGKPHGKPRVVDGAGLEVSVSHSGSWVALAVTDGAPVGVDVEEIRDAEVDSLAGIAFSAAEKATFAEVPAESRQAAFFTYWSRKEAVVKATGKGMSVPMSSLTLSRHDEPPRVVASESSEVDTAVVRMADLAVDSGYRACVAVFTAEPLDVSVHDTREVPA